MDTQTVFHLLIMKQFTPEVGQFWFLPYILLCYGLTPILHSVLDSCERYDGIWYLLSLAALLLFVEITVRNFFVYFALVWIESYLLGMIMCRCKYRKRKLWRYLKTVLVMLAIIAVNVIISGMIIFGASPPPIFIELFYYFQALTGISSVLLLCLVFDRFQKIPAACEQILDLSDKYSFDIYIVHNLFIQGNYSVLNVVKNPILGILLACFLILSSAVFLHKAAEYIQGKCLCVKLGT